SGILEYENDVFKRRISQASEGVEDMPGLLGDDQHRVGGFTSDPDGNIWFTNSLTDKPLGKIDTEGKVTTYGLGSNLTSSTDSKDILYTSLDQIWIQTRSAGIVIARFPDESGTPET